MRASFLHAQNFRSNEPPRQFVAVAQQSFLVLRGDVLASRLAMEARCPALDEAVLIILISFFFGSKRERLAGQDGQASSVLAEPDDFLRHPVDHVSRLTDPAYDAGL